MSPGARRQLNRLPATAVPAILETIAALSANPQRLGKPLGLQFEGYLVARRGPYRIIYSIDEPSRTVRVFTLGHRADIYRRR